jgi:hypothetical protein
MGFWYPDLAVGYYSPVPEGIPKDLIFYFDGFCVLSTLIRPPENSSAQIRIAIFTDNANTVDIFNCMRGLPAYNYILRSSVDIRMKTHHQLRVFHVPGRENGVANAISRHEFVRALRAGLKNKFFEPPQLPLGVAKKMISSGSKSRQPEREPWTRDRLERERAVALGQSIDTGSRNNYLSALNLLAVLSH